MAHLAMAAFSLGENTSYCPRERLVTSWDPSNTFTTDSLAASIVAEGIMDAKGPWGSGKTSYFDSVFDLHVKYWYNTMLTVTTPSMLV